METVTKVCIGATIAIFAGLIIAAIVFNIQIQNGLAPVGFFFLVFLPLYISYRIGEKRDKDNSTATILDLSTRFDSCNEVLDEIDEYLDDSIAKFKEWGRYLKEFEKEHEKAYYAEVALLRQSGFDSGRLVAEYGQDISDLIKIRLKLKDIRYLL